MKTQINGKTLTHKFFITENTCNLDIVSKNQFTVIVDGKQEESIVEYSDEYEILYSFETKKLSLNFEIEIYGGTDITIDCSGKITAYIVPNSCFKLFYNSKFKYIDMSKVNPKNIQYMFKNCENLIDFKVNLDGISDMTGLFEGCVGFTSFPMIDTSFVTCMNRTWKGCSNLTSFPLINTSNVMSMKKTWERCSSLTSFPSINTSKVKKMLDVWRDCKKLTSFPSINTSSVEVMANTWYNCESLPSFPMIDTSKVEVMDYTWAYCKELSSFPLIDTSNVKSMSWTWFKCEKLSPLITISILNI